MKKIILTFLLVLPLSYTFSQIGAQNDISLCKVAKIFGLYAFTDCEPISDYEVIGEVVVSGALSPDIQRSGGQYQPVRDELIKAAKAANYQVEGVILTFITGGVDKAHLVKFKNSSEDHSLARAKRYSGIYIFCDSDPISEYDYIGNINGKNLSIPQYSNVRDYLVRKCTKKYKDAKGVILHLVTGGKDTGEAIKF